MQNTKKFNITYQDIVNITDFDSRFNILNLVGYKYISPRNLSNRFYKNPTWLQVRDEIIKRDYGCDLGINGLYIEGKIIVHHIDPLLEEDIINWNEDKLFNPNNLICCSVDTHNSIHYGRKLEMLVERRPGDTKLW